jgi:hypothetical protein
MEIVFGALRGKRPHEMPRKVPLQIHIIIEELNVWVYTLD